MTELDSFLNECLSVSLMAAKRAGEAILAVYEDDIDVRYKEDESPLTKADERSHRIISSLLSSEKFKQIPVLSEEGRHISYAGRKEWKRFWLVDPLDGTKEFIQRRGEFTVNIALVYNRRPVMGVVFVPARDLLYFAADGLGAYKLEGTEEIDRLFEDKDATGKGTISLADAVNSARRLPLDRPGQAPASRLTMVGSRSHATEASSAFVRTASKKYNEVEMTPAGSALKFGLVAEGSAHLYPRFGPTMEWDTGAGQCVVEQSGGAVIRLPEKTPLLYNKEDLRNPDFVCMGRYSRDLEGLF